MSKRYTNQQKADALQQLDDNDGNVMLTAIQTDIPKRTLYEWKRQRKLQAIKDGQPASGTLQHKKSAVPPQQSAANTDQPDDDEDPYLREYTTIRKRLMDHIFTMTDSLIDDPETAHVRIIALSRLLDRVIKLEALTRKETDDRVIRIEYKYPDGTIHDRPPWAPQEGPYKPFFWRDDEDGPAEKPVPRSTPITAADITW